MILDMLIGPLAGIIGGAATQWLAYKSKGLDIEDRKHEREFDLKMSIVRHKQALEITRAESEGAERRIVLEGEVQANVRDLDNLSAAMATMPTWSGIQPEDSPALRWWKTIIESLQTLVRVFITLYLAWKLALIADQQLVLMSQVTADAVPPSVVGDMMVLVLRGFVEISLTAIGFWFASRGAVLKPQAIGKGPAAKQ